MNLSALVRSLPLSTALLLTGCGGVQTSPATPSAASTSEADAAPAPAGARDPQIMALAKPALACKLEEGAFADDCEALKAWSDNEELFADGKGNDTILSMFGDPDVKVRLLAERKGFDGSYFDDQAHAAKLLSLARAEKDDTVAHGLASYVAKVDAEKLGLQADLRALAKHPSKTFRESLAFHLISSHQTPVAVEIEQALIEDPEVSVRKEAISALSTGGVTPGVEPVCKMLSKQLGRPDDLAGDALWAGSSSKCAGMKAEVAAELAKRTADPSRVTNAVGISYALAASGLCDRDAPAEQKKKAFEIGKRLADARVPDANTRRASLDVLLSCDPPAGAKMLATLSKDKDKFVADAAKEKLAKLQAKK